MTGVQTCALPIYKEVKEAMGSSDISEITENTQKLMETGTLLADADEPGAVVALVLDGGSQAFQTVQLRAGPAAQGSHILSPGRCHHFGCNSRIGNGNDVHALQPRQKITALVYGLSCLKVSFQMLLF